VLIGEIYLPVERLVTYYGADLKGAHLPFNFQLIQARWDARGIAAMVEEYDRAIPDGGWPNWVLGNHDQHRIATRVGAEQARVAAVLLLTLRGTPTLYYGDEIGMRDVPIPPDRVQDPFEKNVPGLGLGRDPERTPMQWSAAPHAGFSAVLGEESTFSITLCTGRRFLPRCCSARRVFWDCLPACFAGGRNEAAGE